MILSFLIHKTSNIFKSSDLCLILTHLLATSRYYNHLRKSMCWVIYHELFETFELECSDHQLLPQKIDRATFHYLHPNARRDPKVESKNSE